MNIEIIAVGTELLGSRFADTNSVWLTERLEDLGLQPIRRTIVGDQGPGLETSLRLALSSGGLVLVGGGLGPTGDDKTREATAAALNRGLVFREDVMAAIEERFRRFGWPLTEPNRRQAWVVEGAEVLANPLGTAPGQWLEAEGRTIILLPGPPHELKGMFQAQVLPRLARLGRRHLARRLIRTTGLGESAVEARIEGLYPDDPDRILTVLASPGRVDLRIAASSSVSPERAGALADELTSRLKARLGSAVYAESEIELGEVVIGLLRRDGTTLSVAESCTGGLVSHRLTDVPGSSLVFLGGYVAYADAAKVRDLGIAPSLLESRGAVSQEVVEAMASGARLRTGSDWALALSGIAGPGGGTPEKPVGLVHIALAGPAGLIAERHVFSGRREAVKFQAGQRALDLLRRRLSGLD
jgi:nicotinamide-nucleotide amidase